MDDRQFGEPTQAPTETPVDAYCRGYSEGVDDAVANDWKTLVEMISEIRDRLPPPAPAPREREGEDARNVACEYHDGNPITRGYVEECGACREATKDAEIASLRAKVERYEQREKIIDRSCSKAYEKHAAEVERLRKDTERPCFCATHAKDFYANCLACEVELRTRERDMASREASRARARAEAAEKARDAALAREKGLREALGAIVKWQDRGYPIPQHGMPEEFASLRNMLTGSIALEAK